MHIKKLNCTFNNCVFSYTKTQNDKIQQPNRLLTFISQTVDWTLPSTNSVGPTTTKLYWNNLFQKTHQKQIVDHCLFSLSDGDQLFKSNRSHIQYKHCCDRRVEFPRPNILMKISKPNEKTGFFYWQFDWLKIVFLGVNTFRSRYRYATVGWGYMETSGGSSLYMSNRELNRRTSSKRSSMEKLTS